MAETWDRLLMWSKDVKDENDMASDSATHLATQQSIKAYVDAASGGGKRIAYGSYSGNASTNRQITTGFKCGWVYIVGVNIQNSLGGAISMVSGVTFKQIGVGTASVYNTGLTLHATNGFIVGNNSDTTYYANYTGSVNIYFAIEA